MNGNYLKDPFMKKSAAFSANPLRSTPAGHVGFLGLLVASFLSWIVPTASVNAQNQIQELTKLNLKAVKKISFFREKEEFRAVIAVVFDYWGERDLRISESKFKITVLKNVMIDGEKVTIRIPFGEATGFMVPSEGKLLPMEEAMIPATASGKERTEGIVYLPINVGPAGNESIDRIFEIVNVFGDPEADFQLELDGKGEAALRIERGWITQKGVGIEFLFRPVLQREVLFE